ncbi:MAG: hypothetical protein NTZ54_12170 [Alphaproteobacteria bacterium]|nr:hypothetical protein [Alphaproteobacteria bacterium]
MSFVAFFVSSPVAMMPRMMVTPFCSVRVKLVPSFSTAELAPVVFVLS